MIICFSNTDWSLIDGFTLFPFRHLLIFFSSALSPHPVCYTFLFTLENVTCGLSAQNHHPDSENSEGSIGSCRDQWSRKLCLKYTKPWKKGAAWPREAGTLSLQTGHGADPMVRSRGGCINLLSPHGHQRAHFRVAQSVLDPENFVTWYSFQ